MQSCAYCYDGEHEGQKTLSSLLFLAILESGLTLVDLRPINLRRVSKRYTVS